MTSVYFQCMNVLRIDVVTYSRYRSQFDEVFSGLVQMDGKITGNVAREEMVKSKLTNKELGKIWTLCDLDKDGMFDIDEFALCMHLINVKLDGHDIPGELPPHLIPPSKRKPF